MKTTFYLVRHGSHCWLGKGLAGRLPGVHLNATGEAEAAALPGRFEHLPLAAVYTSPLERARQTAAPVAGHRSLPMTLSDAIQEIDFGEWTGKTFAELDGLPEWRRWNHFRSGSRPPGGETMLEVQARMVRELECLRTAHAGESVALFGHADPIKAALIYFLGMPLDLFHRIEISPASVSALEVDDWGARVLCVNAPEPPVS